jgi:outer membrane biosynthesis protein TonB
MENRIFKYAIFVSLAVHSFVLTVLWLTGIQFDKNDQQKVMEIVYQATVVEEKKAPVKTLQLKRLTEEKKPDIPRPFSPQDAVKMQPVPAPEKAPARLDLPNKSAGHLHEPGGKRMVRVPMLDSDKMMGSRYVTYHEQVREKIRNRAYFYVDDPRFETGEVYLTFILGSDGVLREVKIIEDRTGANNYLRNVGLRSIRESSPFPPFPRDLNYPELTYNVVISFEMGK